MATELTLDQSGLECLEMIPASLVSQQVWGLEPVLTVVSQCQVLLLATC